jgi:hypothetical protein
MNAIRNISSLKKIEMKNRFPDGKRLMSIGVFGVMFLSVGAEPASAAGFPNATCRPGYTSYRVDHGCALTRPCKTPPNSIRL